MLIRWAAQSASTFMLTRVGGEAVEQATVGEVVLAYEVRGEGTPVVLVSGLGGGAEAWDATRTRGALVEAGFRTVVFNNRGIPPTTVPEPPYTVSDMAQDTIGLIEHLDFGEPCFVMGTSLGALIAQSVALARPDLVRAVILNTGGGNYPLAFRIRLEASVAAMRCGGDAAATALRSTLLASLPAGLLADDDIVQNMMDAWSSVGALEFADMTGELGQQEALLTWAREDHLDELEHMAVACLVVANEHDSIFTLGGRHDMLSRIPEAELVVIPGEGHICLNGRSMKHLNTTAVEFLRRVEHDAPNPGRG